MQFLKRTLKNFSEDHCATLAAAFAYSIAFALLLYLLLSVLTFGLLVT